MDDLSEILILAARLPSGLNDPMAAKKLVNELEELNQSLAQDDYVGALTEAADAAYYAAKHLQYVAHLLDISVADVLACGKAKYSLRAQPNNPKNDAAEREAVLSALKKEN